MFYNFRELVLIPFRLLQKKVSFQLYVTDVLRHWSLQFRRKPLIKIQYKGKIMNLEFT